MMSHYALYSQARAYGPQPWLIEIWPSDMFTTDGAQLDSTILQAVSASAPSARQERISERKMLEIHALFACSLLDFDVIDNLTFHERNMTPHPIYGAAYEWRQLGF